MSMPITTLTSSSNTSISHTSPPENRRKSRDVSFSSYLEGDDEETFVLQLRRPNNPRGIFGKNKTQDREIDVFDAEKYFREGPKYIPRAAAATNLSSHRQIKKDEAFEMVATKEPPSVATPSICSESSWNSRGALLHSVARNQKPSKRTSYKKTSFLTNIRCNYCSCGDKNSVDIDDKTEETGSKQSICPVFVNGKSKQGDKNCVKLEDPGSRVNSNGHFTFPVLNQGITKLQEAKGESNISSRKSLEVFGSPVMMGSRTNSLRVEKKLSMVTWDAIDDQQIMTKFTPISNEVDNDSDSDASSDLFEIESLSKGDPFLSRTASDGLSGSLPTTTCYAPSEASVEWSVITASAADFSVLSDYEELKSSKHKVGQKILAGRDLPSKRYSGILPGCKNQKAVRVAEDVYRGVNSDKEYSNSRTQIRSESLITSMARFKDHENRLAGLFRQQSFDARMLSQPRSANGVHLLHTK